MSKTIELEVINKDSTDYMKRKTTTVEKLIEALKQMPPNATITTEGCDCYGDVCSITFDEEYNNVILNRGLNYNG